MKTFYLVPILKGKASTFFCCYILTKSGPELFAPCFDKKSAELIEMDYNKNMHQPPYGFEIPWENQEGRLLYALKRTLAFTSYWGSHKVFILDGYSVTCKSIKVTKR